MKLQVWYSPHERLAGQLREPPPPVLPPQPHAQTNAGMALQQEL